MRDPSLHIFYWCPVCHQHKTNIYPANQWKRHQADLEDARHDDLVCPDCEEKQRQRELSDTCGSEFYEPGPYKS